MFRHSRRTCKTVLLHNSGVSHDEPRQSLTQRPDFAARISSHRHRSERSSDRRPRTADVHRPHRRAGRTRACPQALRMPRPRSADPILAPAGHVALLLHERVRGRGKSVSGIGEHDETEIDVARRGVIRALPGRRRRASSKRISATKPMPTIAVDTSTSMIIHNGIRLTRAAAIAGEAMLIAVCNVPLIALTRSNRASGRSAG